MGNSVVDMGAAAVDYVSDAASDFYDYMTGSPEASASGGYYKSLGPGARQYYSGPGEDKSSSIMGYIGFDDGGEVPLQDDGSLPSVDDLRFMTPEEVETGSYNYLQDMEKQMMYHLSEAQNPVEMLGDIFPSQRSLDNTRYHYEEAERLRDQIDLFRERRASAVLNYPESDQKMYMKEGQAPYVKGFPDSMVEGYKDGGAVDLGAGSPKEMEEFLEFLRKNRPVYKEGDERPYTYYSDMLMVPEEKRNTFEQEYEILPRADLYEGFAEPSYGITLKDIEKGAARLSDMQDEAEMGNPYAGTSGNFVPQQYEIVDGKVIANPVGFDDGGEVPVEEAGIGSFMYDMVTGNVPSDQYNSMRTSGRMDDPMAQGIYGEDPTFMERLVKEYNYPANTPMQDEQGFAIMDPETGGQKMMMATDFNLPEYMRTGRPRPDMPTYGELEDARAHALASALMAKDYGPETAKTAGGIKEFSEMLPGFGSSKYKDTKMDLRNNALGVKLLKEAGVNATPAQLARTVDREVFSQLDRILDRPKDRQDTPAKDQPFADHYFKSPEGGLDVYFPRDKEGYFDTSYIYD
jgi:hypothetical protein